MSNEDFMRERGRARVWKVLSTRSGNSISAAKTQDGQQLVIKEADRLTPLIQQWALKGTSPSYRKFIAPYFQEVKESTELIASILLFLVKPYHLSHKDHKEGELEVPSRHVTIHSLQKNIFDNLLEFENVWRIVEKIVDECFYFIKEAEVKDEGFLTQNGDYIVNLKKHLKYSCTLPMGIIKKLSIKAVEAFYPLPMIEPPAPWNWCEGVLSGGYHHNQQPLIRLVYGTPDYDRYPASIFKLVNLVQDVPWEVNDDLLGAVEMDLQFPEKSDYVKSKFPEMTKEMLPEVDLKNTLLREEEVGRIRKLRSSHYEQLELYAAENRDYESAVGKYRVVQMALDIAKRYSGQTIWFPHNYDFRGRIYPIPIGLNPQGSDSVKAMIQYKDGQVLDSVGVEWCWAYLASLYGDDKIPFKQRIERGKELINEDYHKADEPYQFLAHQLEMQEWVKNPNYPMKTRIHLDACNSGSQFTSAITGDRGGCEATNVIPTYDPQGNQIRRDAYTEVAEIARRIALRESKDTTLGQGYIDQHEVFYGLLSEHGRKVCKQPVMVSNYGGTAQGRATILFDMMRELNAEREWINKKVSSNFAKVVGEAIGDTLKGGKAFESYIHKMCTLIAKAGSPVEWTTPDGFYVKHVKFREIKKEFSVKLKDSTATINLIKFTNDLNPGKMKSAVSPNYIHSLDAMLLRKVALKMFREGITVTDWIHDSFGCQPNYVSQMLEITKKEFVKMMVQRPLTSLDNSLRSLATKVRVCGKELEQVKVPQLKGINHKTGLKETLDSEWFFS